MGFKRGDILEGTDRTPKGAKHPIVFISELEEGLFLGVMLTHRKKGNVGLEEKHFEIKPDREKERNSFFVNRILIKDKTWGPFSVTGKLSDLGIGFVEESLSPEQPIWWEELIRDIK